MSNKKSNKENTGGKTTFMIQIQFTQNSTWQGKINWIEEDRTQNFRSELEMIKLMSEAIGSLEENDVNWEE